MSDLESAVAAMMGNIMRVMRGSGDPRMIATDIKQISEFIKEHEADEGKATAHARVADGVESWGNYSRFNGRNSEDGYELRNIVHGAIRLVAECYNENTMQYTKAEREIFGAVGSRLHRLDKERAEAMRAEYESLSVERDSQAADDVAADISNGKVLGAANDNDAGSYVYFVTDGDAIKIGKANNPKSRLSGLQTSHHKALRILALTPGDETLERQLHSKFYAYRIRGEWFRDCKPIRDYISTSAETPSDNSDNYWDRACFSPQQNAA